ncbi:MAG: Gfo/Idh/MocA family oxidoreductase [Patescibacteria group bacterium]
MHKKIGLIGAGEFGNFASDVINLLPNFKLAAIADTNEQAAYKLAKNYGSTVYKDYHELLEDPEINLVMINTPNHTHAQIVIEALDKGKRVLCEKPLGINRQEIQAVEKKLREAKGVLLVNYLLPHSTLYKKLQHIMRKEKYGNLKYVRIENLATESKIKNGWYWEDSLSGGWFLTADIHFYDLLMFLKDEKWNVVNSYEFKKDNKTGALFTGLKSESGALANIFHDFGVDYSRAAFKAHFCFEKANVEVLGWVPISMKIKTKKSEKEINETGEREHIYQKMVAKNLKDLAKMDHDKSIDKLRKVIAGSEIAFIAQESI